MPLLISFFDMKTTLIITVSFFLLFVPARGLAQKADSLRKSHSVKSFLLQEVQVRPTDTDDQEGVNKHHNLQELTDKILEYTPGINMIRRGNFAMEPTLRSLSNGQITVSIDGMRIFSACTDRMDPVSSYIEPNNLQSFTVLYEPGINSYGSGIGGGLNFRLKQPSFSNAEKWSGILGSGIETNGLAFQMLGSIEFSSPKFAILGNGIYRSSRNYRAAHDDEVAFSQYHKWNGNLSVLLKAGKRSYVKADYLQDEGHDIGYPALTMDVAYAKGRMAALSYVANSQSGLLHWQSKAYFNFVDHAMDDTRRPAETVPMHMDMPGTSKTFGAFSSLDIYPGKSHHLNIRADGFHNVLNATMTMYPSTGSSMFMYTLPHPFRTDVGLNLSDAISISKKLMINPGVRLEYMHDGVRGAEAKAQLSGMFSGNLSNSRLIPDLSVSLSYKPRHQWTIHTSVGRGARAATLQESYAFYIYNRLDAYDYIGNPTLGQEKSLNLSAGTAYHSDRMEFEINVFGYFMKDYIAGKVLDGYSSMTAGAKGVKQYINIHSARLYGSEMVLKWKATERLSATSSNTVTRGLDGDGHALPLIAPLKSVNTIVYAVSKVIFRAEGVTNAAQQHVNTEVYGETPTPGSTIISGFAGRQLSLTGGKKIKLDIGVENIFDARYFQHLDILKIPRPGRNITFHTTWQF